MLKTNSTKAIDNTWRHVCEHLTSCDVEGLSVEEMLIRQFESMRGDFIYVKAVELVAGGFFDIYYDDMRASLKEILEETDEEANRYDDDRVYKIYCHLIAKTIEKKLEKHL